MNTLTLLRYRLRAGWRATLGHPTASPRSGAPALTAYTRRAGRLLAVLTLLSLGLGSARIAGVAHADSTIWITQPSGSIGPDQSFTQTYTCPADYGYVGVVSNPGQLPYSNTSDSGVSATMDGGGAGSPSLTMLFINWDPTSSHRFDITLACHGNGSSWQTDPIGGGVFGSGGTVLATTHTYTIFWRPTSYHYEGPPFVEAGPDALDVRYENIQNQFFQDVGGTSYYNILTQYGTANGPVLNDSTFGGAWEDTQSYPHSGASGTDPLQDVDIQNEVKHAIAVNNWPTKNSVFFVYTSWGTTTCDGTTGCSNTGFNGDFCGYHSSFADSSGNAVYYSMMPDAGTGPFTCIGSGHAPNGDYYADQEVSIDAHELFETVSDPGSGWRAFGGTQGGYNITGGAEMADLCSGDYPNAPAGNGGNVTLNNGHTYYLPGMYSMADNSCITAYGGTQQINDTDPAIQYGGGSWFYSAGRPAGFNDLNNDVHATTNNGDSVSYTFNGTGISYIAEAGNAAGNVAVSIDGVYQGTNTVPPGPIGVITANQGAQVLYSISGLAAGQHTIKLVKTGGVYMLLDAFQVQVEGATVNDTTSLASYSGSSWGYSTGRPYGDFHGDEHYATANGDSLTFTFTGTRASVLGEKNWAGGTSAVTVDDQPSSTINTVTPTREAQQVIFDTGTLRMGTHTILISKTSGTYLEIDGFTVQTPGQPINDTDPDLRYQGPGQVSGAGHWFLSNGRGLGDYHDDVHATYTFADDFQYTFNGTGVSFITELSSAEGQANVYLDGAYQTTINGYSHISNQPQQTLYTVAGLQAGQHTLMVVNESSSDLLLDALSVR